MTYAELVAEITASDPEVHASKMFGMPCLKLPNGKVFAGHHGDAMTFKLGPQQEEVLKLDGVKVFEPMAGRPMNGWIEVPELQSDHWMELAKAAREYVTQATAKQ